MKWLLGGICLVIVWIIFALTNYRKYRKELKQIKRFKTLVRPHPVIGEPTITSRIGVSLINNRGTLEFYFRFVDNYDWEVIDDGANVVDYALTKGFYKITDDPNEINRIAEVALIKKSMMGKRKAE